MTDKKDEGGRRQILGNIGNVVFSRSRGSKPRFDLTKCQFYDSSTVSADVANKWLVGVPQTEDITVSGPVNLHTFILSDNVHKISLCDLFFVIRVIATDEVVYVQTLPHTSVTEPMDVTSPGASGPSETSSSGSSESYQVGAKGFVVSPTSVTSTSLRDHLMASSSTMALLRQNEKHTGRPQSDAAIKIHQLLKDHFREIPNYRYEVGMPSHKWNGVVGLDARLLLSVADECMKIMSKEPTLLRLDPPVYVIGDLHGNYKDFAYFAQAFGLWTSAEFVPARFLFLGDYVDRGLHSIETLAFVLSLKVRYPDKIFLLRGNHECSEINGDEELYMSGSFKSQCKLTYGMRDGEELWNAFNRCFDMMPLAAVIDEKVFCVHAGIPRYIARNPDCNILDTIASIPRPPSITDDLVFDLIWADPATLQEERFIGMDGFPPGFGRNTRGPATCVFGKEAVKKFCENSGCSHMIRAHQSPKLGVDISKNAAILTVFSSSHYCGGFNRAASVLVHDHRLDIILSNPESSEPNIVAQSDDYRI